MKIALRDRFNSDSTSFRAGWLYEYDVAGEFKSAS
jgi:hypothetical protein